MKKKILRIIIPIALVYIAYIILDYVNIPTLMGLETANINGDIFSAIYNSVIVIVLYVVSFYFIDNKQNGKDANAKDVTDVLMKKTYQECLDILKLLDNKDLIEKYIIPKVDGKKSTLDNDIINNFQKLPFSSFDVVIDLAKSGYIERDKLESYLDIKKEYGYLVNMKIILFDLVCPENDCQYAMYKDIHARDKSLKNKLTDLLS